MFIIIFLLDNLNDAYFSYRENEKHNNHNHTQDVVVDDDANQKHSVVVNDTNGHERSKKEFNQSHNIHNVDINNESNSTSVS
eukprot:Pgem_evm2s13849